MQAFSPYVRVVSDTQKQLDAVTLAATRSFTIDMSGFNTLILYMNFTRSAATAVSVTATVRHPNSGSTDYKLTSISAISSSGVGDRDAYTDTYTTSVSDNWQVIIPVVGSICTISVSAASGAAGDILTVYSQKGIS